MARRSLRIARWAFVSSPARFVALAAMLSAACGGLGAPRLPAAEYQQQTSPVLLDGQTLELHLAAPRSPAAPMPLVLYATGDGGWFGTAIEMFHDVVAAGYPAVGISARAFLRLARPRGATLDADRLAASYQTIITTARTALGLPPQTPVILTGWSRGAAFAVIAAAKLRASVPVRGVVAIGLSDGEDLRAGGDDVDTDDGSREAVAHRWPFEPYPLLRSLSPLRAAVIQATHDNYLPSAEARRLLGPPTPAVRLFEIDAKNHRFAGGGRAFDAALAEALTWVRSR